MGMMAKMRGLAPAFIITVGALFVLFMVISDSNVLEALGGRTNNVGSINGEDISYQEFVNAVDQQRENQKKQTGKDVDEKYGTAKGSSLGCLSNSKTACRTD